MDAPPPPSSPPAPPTTASRSTQAAIGAFLVVLLGLLAFRGYGTWLGAKPTESPATALTDLNRASRAELEQIPGIGPGIAKQIDDHRRAEGAFRSVDQLRDVKGIGPVTLDKVRPFLRVEPSSPSGDQLPEPLVLERKPAGQVSAPYPRTGGAGSKLQHGDPPIDLNAADLAELMRLPAVGPVTAKNIIAARSEKPFASVADLDRVKGIGPKTFEKIRPFVLVK